MFPYDNQSQSQALFQNQLLQSLAPAQPQSIHTTKVNGRAGAEAFNMPPNSDGILLDLSDPIIYFIQTDGAGYKTITPYDMRGRLSGLQRLKQNRITLNKTYAVQPIKSGSLINGANPYSTQQPLSPLLIQNRGK